VLKKKLFGIRRNAYPGGYASKRQIVQIAKDNNANCAIEQCHGVVCMQFDSRPKSSKRLLESFWDLEWMRRIIVVLTGLYLS
jgi:hypothetical protein